MLGPMNETQLVFAEKPKSYVIKVGGISLASCRSFVPVILFIASKEMCIILQYKTRGDAFKSLL